MITFKATISSLVEDAVYHWIENGMTSWAINPAKFECEYVEVDDGSND